MGWLPSGSFDEGTNSANYYLRLNSLLGRPNNGTIRGFDQLDKAWERLNQWLEDDMDGRLGLPTATNDLYGSHVGYPISQAIMRQTDLEELPDFFYWCGLEPHDEGADTAFFVQGLRRWATRSTCSFSKQLKEAFRSNQERHIQSIAEMAHTHFRAWDGSKSMRGTGIREARILVQLTSDRRSFQLFLHPRAPKGFPEGFYGQEELARLDNSDWFEPLSEKSVAQWLSGQAVELTRERFRITLPRRLVVPFLPDGSSELGGWLSIARVHAGENHRILCHASMRHQVESYLRDCGKDGWRVMESRDPIYRDWLCFVNVRITQFGQSELDELDCLVPAKMVGIRLSGGLPLRRGVWLRGGEPEAIVTTDTSLPVILDDLEIVTVRPGATSIDLRKFDLPEGTHQISVGEKSASYTVSASGNALSWMSAINSRGYPFRRISPTALDPLSLAAEALPPTEVIPSGQLYVSGARVLYSPADPPPPRQHLLVLPYGARSYIVLGRYVGEVFEPDLPTTQPPWKAGEFLRGYKLNIPFEPQWLVTISHSNNETLRPLGSPKEASLSQVQDSGCETWLRWARKRRLSKRLSKKHRGWAGRWTQYSDLARDFTG